MGLFSEQFEALIQLINEAYPEELDFSGDDSGYRLHEMWIGDFCKSAPTEDLKEWLRHEAVGNQRSKGIGI